MPVFYYVPIAGIIPMFQVFMADRRVFIRGGKSGQHRL